jgi:hypothetical protein
LVAALLLAACTSEDSHNDDAAARCHGGLGIAFQIATAACATGTFTESQLVLTSNGAYHNYDYGGLVPIAAVAWPLDLHPGDPASALFVALDEASGCTMSGDATFVVDREVCLQVPIATTCSCSTP